MQQDPLPTVPTCDLFHMKTPSKDDAPEDESSDPSAQLDKDHGDEVPLFKHPEGNVEKLIERGRQMGF